MMRITVAHADAGMMVVARADAGLADTGLTIGARMNGGGVITVLANVAQEDAVQTIVIPTVVNRPDTVRSDMELTFGGRAILQALPVRMR